MHMPSGVYAAIVAIAVLLVTAGMASAQKPVHSVAVTRAVDAAARSAGAPLRTTYSATGDVVRFMAASRQRPIPVVVPKSASAERRARAFASSYGDAFGIVDQASELRAERVMGPDGVGMEHVRFKQVHRGIPIAGAEFSVHLVGGAVVAANGELVPGLDDFPLKPRLTAAQAAGRARDFVEQELGVSDARIEAPRLEILDRERFDGIPRPVRLTWFVEAIGSGLDQFIWLDAETGAVLLHFNQQPHALQRRVYTAAGGPSRLGTLARQEGQAPTGNPDVDRAYDWAGDTYEYFLNEHGRDSYDDGGASLSLTVDWCDLSGCNNACPCANAFWDGENLRAVFGAGYAGADDVVAHELTHAVTEYSAKLYYYMQSGALNESFSDIFGEAVDLTNGAGNDTLTQRWLLGEDVVPGGLRSMTNPVAFEDPAKLSDPQFSCSGAIGDLVDQGGVHTNSAIANHAFALMVDGGSYNFYNLGGGIGLSKAARIMYRVLTHYLHSASGFRDFYDLTWQACQDLKNQPGSDVVSSDCVLVAIALDAVELGQPWPCTPTPPAVPIVCPSGQTEVDTFFDGFENGLGSWTMQAEVGANQWGDTTKFVASGAHAVRATDADGLNDSRFTMISGVTIPSGGRMHFLHSYDFQATATELLDGGVLEYSTNNGASWIDAGSLMVAGATYGGALSGMHANPIAFRNAFVRTSFGYTATKLNLSSLAGQTVKFRFRIGTDLVSNADHDDYGWFIDDVRIYRCASATPTPTVTPPPVAMSTPTRTATSTRTPTVTQTPNHAILITSGPAGDPNPVNSAGTIALTVGATDTHGHGLSYTWSASCPGLPSNGGFNTQWVANLIWTAPTNSTGSQKTCAISVIVSDGNGVTATAAYDQLVSAIAPENVSLTPSSLAGLGPYPIGVSSPQMPISINNNTGSTIEILLYVAAGGNSEDFSLGCQTIGTLFTASQTLIPFCVTFTPQGCGPRSAVAVLYYKPPGSPFILRTLPIAGFGPDCPTATPSSTATATPTLTPQPTPAVNADLVWSFRPSAPVGGQVVASTAAQGKVYTVGWPSIGAGGLVALYAYDPLTGAWSRKADATKVVCEGSAAVELDGKVYVVRSECSGSEPLRYDPSTDEWSVGAAPPAALTWVAAAATSGKVYAIGGGINPATAAVYAYDPAANSWAAVTSMNVARSGASGATLGGRIFALGGQDDNGLLAAEVYDPNTNVWTNLAPLPRRRVWGGAASLGRTLYSIGGVQFGGGSPQPNVDAMHLDVGSWVPQAGLQTARRSFATGAVNGRLYVIGGLGPAGADLASVEEGVPVNPPPSTPTTSASATRSVTATPTVTPPPSSTFTVSPTITPTRTGTATASRTATPAPAVFLDPIAAPLVIGAQNTLTGTGFTQGSVVVLFIATGAGVHTAGPFSPSSWTPTTLIYALPSTVPVGNGFATVQVVNVDQGFIGSNVRGQHLYGAASAGLPTITGIDAMPLNPPDPAVPLASVSTALAQGSTVTIAGTGFAQPIVALFSSAASAVALEPLPGWTANQLQVVIPADVPTGPGSIQVLNRPAFVASGAVSVPIGARIRLDGVSQAGLTITATGTGFSTLTIISFFNAQGGSVVNLGALVNGSQSLIPFVLESSNRMTFQVPNGAVSGAAYVQLLNPPFIEYTSTGATPNGALSLLVP